MGTHHDLLYYEGWLIVHAVCCGIFEALMAKGEKTMRICQPVTEDIPRHGTATALGIYGHCRQPPSSLHQETRLDDMHGFRHTLPVEQALHLRRSQMHQDAVIGEDTVDKHVRKARPPIFKKRRLHLTRRLHLHGGSRRLQPYIPFHSIRVYLVERTQQAIKETGDPEMMLGMVQIVVAERQGVQAAIGLSVITENGRKRCRRIGEPLVTLHALYCNLATAMKHLTKLIHRARHHLQCYMLRFLLEKRTRNHIDRTGCPFPHRLGTSQKYLHDCSVYLQKHFFILPSAARALPMQQTAGKRILSGTLPQLPIILHVIAGIMGSRIDSAAPLTNPRIKLTLPLLQDDHPRSIAQVIVFRVATGEAAISQKDAIIHHAIVIVMVMTAEDTHHVARLLHLGKHSRIEARHMTGLLTCAIERRLHGKHGCPVFRERIMHEGNGRQHLAAIGRLVFCRLITIPRQLTPREPLVASHSLHLRIRISLYAIDQRGRLCPRRPQDRQYIVEIGSLTGRHHAVGSFLHHVIKRSKRCLLFTVMIAEDHTIRYTQALENAQHPGQAGRARRLIDDVARHHHQIGLLRSHHLADVLFRLI